MRRLFLAASLVFATAAGAQVVKPRPTTPPRPARNPADTTGGVDSTKVDSAAAKVLIKWADDDSVTTELLSRKGYEVTRYQGVKVVFNAKTRTLYLEGGPAGVGRAGTILIGDTITYNDSTKIVLALGDTLILRDPSRGSADVIALHQMRYNTST